ncbi:MAG: endonuclease/exonuclease/phosphatase family protein [Pyrinomonadaceae bacterium]
MSYNIRFGGEARDGLIASVVRACDADIVVLQEATDPDVVERIARGAGMSTWASRPGHSTAFLSRVAIESFRWIEHPEVRRTFIEIKPAGSHTKIFGVHLSAVHSNWTERRRVRELRALLHCINEDRKDFHVITGDFNTLAPGERLEMRRLPRRLRLVALLLGGRVRFRTIQIMLDEGYTDAYRLLHRDEGYTFPVWDPHVRLDYVFVPSIAKDCVQSCAVVGDAPNVREASDHFPLVAEIELP